MRVLELLAAEKNDTTAQALHAALRAAGDAIGLATVYRTLALFSEKGLVDTLAHMPGELCYRLCGDAHHHHLVCSSCHRVIELTGCNLAPLLEEVGLRHDFVVTEHAFEVTGICAECRTRASGR
jgi:Fur family ferric uptake transcriptional regulator